MFRTCLECGRVCPPSAGACDCGYNFTGGAPVQRPASAVAGAPVAPETKAPRRSGKLWWIAGAVAMAVVVAANSGDEYEPDPIDSFARQRVRQLEGELSDLRQRVEELEERVPAARRRY